MQLILQTDISFIAKASMPDQITMNFQVLRQGIKGKNDAGMNANQREFYNIILCAIQCQ
jgi:hypothetical protein